MSNIGFENLSEVGDVPPGKEDVSVGLWVIRERVTDSGANGRLDRNSWRTLVRFMFYEWGKPGIREGPGGGAGTTVEGGGTRDRGGLGSGVEGEIR